MSIRLSQGSILFVATASCLMIACRSGSVIDLPGEYSVSADWGQSKLVLRADHSMEQHVTSQRVGVKDITGRWDLDHNIVTLTPCLEVGRKADGLWSSYCSRELTIVGWNRVLLSSDSGFSYQRVGPN